MFGTVYSEAFDNLKGKVYFIRSAISRMGKRDVEKRGYYVP